jgi:hypothetical protein
MRISISRPGEVIYLLDQKFDIEELMHGQVLRHSSLNWSLNGLLYVYIWPKFKNSCISNKPDNSLET